MIIFIDNLKKKIKTKINYYLEHKNKKIQTITRIFLFFLLFLVFFSIIYFVFSFFNFSSLYVPVLENIFKQNYDVLVMKNYDGLIIKGKNIFISNECNANFELAVFIALILATFIVSWKRRFIAIVFLLPLIYLFNLFRIYIIIFGILNWSLNSVNLLHTLLFKIGFFVFFGIFYYLFLYFATKNNFGD
jgi:exosortase/archaeosortase family protein